MRNIEVSIKGDVGGMLGVSEQFCQGSLGICNIWYQGKFGKVGEPATSTAAFMISPNFQSSGV